MPDAIKVGVFMFVVLVLLGVFIIKIEEIPIGTHGVREIRVRFPNVAGLDKKAAVRVAGVRIGKVKDIILQDQGAEIILEVQQGLELGVGARAAVRNMGLLGDKYVELIPGDPSKGHLPENAVLSGSYPPSYDEILILITKIGEDVKALTGTFRASLSGEKGRSRIEAILNNLQILTEELKTLAQENRQNIRSLTVNLKNSSDQFNQKLPQILEAVQNLAEHLDALVEENRQSVGETIQEFKESSRHLKTTLAHLETITERVKKGEGTVGKLFTEDTAHESLVRTLDSVKSGVNTLSDTLGRVQRWKLNVHFRGEYQGESTESKTYAGFILTPQKNRFYLVELADDPRGRRKEKTETVTLTHPDGTSETQTKTSISYDKTYRISAMFGWRIKNFQLRAGLLESTGGLALDWQPWKKSMMTLEAYDFGTDYGENMHLKLWGRYFLTPNLYLTAGWDDLLNSDQDTWTLGAGLTWTDEDLKYLLGSVKP